MVLLSIMENTEPEQTSKYNNVYQSYQKQNIKAFIGSKRVEWAGRAYRDNGIRKLAMKGKSRREDTEAAPG